MNKLPEIIIACDFANKQDLAAFLKPFQNEPVILKLGLEILYNEGFDLISELKQKGFRIFADLKVFDTPNTAFQAVQALCKHQPDYITVHLNGGLAMLKAVVEAAADCETEIIGVTTLTSLDYDDLIQIVPNYTNISGPDYLSSVNMNLITIGMVAGIKNIVCSVHDSRLIKHLEPDLLTFCPGISVSNDVGKLQGQKRLAKVDEALENQVDYVIIGRALTLSDDPFKTYQYIQKLLKTDVSS